MSEMILDNKKSVQSVPDEPAVLLLRRLRDNNLTTAPGQVFSSCRRSCRSCCAPTVRTVHATRFAETTTATTSASSTTTAKAPTRSASIKNASKMRQRKEEVKVYSFLSSDIYDPKLQVVTHPSRNSAKKCDPIKKFQHKIWLNIGIDQSEKLKLITWLIWSVNTL